MNRYIHFRLESHELHANFDKIGKDYKLISLTPSRYESTAFGFATKINAVEFIVIWEKLPNETP